MAREARGDQLYVVGLEAADTQQRQRRRYPLLKVDAGERLREVGGKVAGEIVDAYGVAGARVGMCV